MKRFITGLFSLALSLLVMTATAFAAHPWQIRMSDPTTANQLRTFNIEYTALSTASESITVRLLQDGSQIGSQTTSSGGGSDTFTVTVPADGTYTYQMKATSSTDGEALPKFTPEKTVSVSTPAASQTSVITVAQSSTSTGGGTGGATTGGRGSGTTAADGAGAEVAGAAEGQQAGTVSDQAALTGEGVLGAETKEAKPGVVNKDNAPAIIAGVIAAIGLAYYYFFRRRRSGSE